jgi:hypothetical protein
LIFFHFNIFIAAKQLFYLFYRCEATTPHPNPPLGGGISEDRANGIPHPEITSIRLTGNDFFNLFASIVESKRARGLD